MRRNHPPFHLTWLLSRLFEVFMMGEESEGFEKLKDWKKQPTAVAYPQSKNE
jgi:hypothetical protein